MSSNEHLSYADVASHGPSQSAAEVITEIEHRTSTDTSELIDVDSHISTVSSDFTTQSVQTETQAEQLEREAYDELVRTRNKAAKTAKSIEGKAKRNADNPVVLGNAVLTAVVVGAVGFTAYKRYQTPEGFSWKTGFGLLGLLVAVGVGDYFVSNQLFKKYPPKE